MTFEDEGFAIVIGFVAKENLSEVYQYTLMNKPNGDFKDPSVPNSPAFYNDLQMVKLHEYLLPKVEKLTDLELFKTYCYYRTYKKGDILRMHSDRPACEVSVTMNLGYEGGNWALWIMNYYEEASEVFLEQGDAVLYRGCDLSHWRGINRSADNYSQLFLHYVDKNGPNAWAKDDKFKTKEEAIAQ